MVRRSLYIALAVLVALLALLWVARAWLAGEVARRYFAAHGVTGTVAITDLGLSGVSGSFALGPADARDLSARRILLRFDPLSFLPKVVEVRLDDPVIHARVDAKGRVTLPALQAWLDSLPKAQGPSRWVSDDLAVALTGMTLHLTTPAGAIRIAGDVKLVRNLPVVAHLTAGPAAIAWNSTTLALRAARLDYDSTGRLRLHLAGDARHPALTAQGLDADLYATGFYWRALPNGLSLAVDDLHVVAKAASLQAGQSLASPAIDLHLTHGQAQLENGALRGRAHAEGHAEAGFDPRLADALKSDPALAKAAARNLARLKADFAADVGLENQVPTLMPTKPLQITGADGGRLTLTGGPRAWHVVLAGRGLPAITADVAGLTMKDGIAADLGLSARFDYGLARGVALKGHGAMAWRQGRLTFVGDDRCTDVSLAGFATLARGAHASLCPEGGVPLLAADAKGWAFHAAMRGASAMLPLPNADLTKGEALIDLAQKGAARTGRIILAQAVIADRTLPIRYKPMTGAGLITLAGNRWRGQLDVKSDKTALGQVAFTHDMGTGTGSAHIDAPKLAFAADGFQPSDLSPLLAALKHTDGAARFSGDLAWSGKGMTSSGDLAVAGLDFITPMGKAHTVKTAIHFTSLLPPATAPNQAVTIDRIDWTIPFSHFALAFGMGSQAVTVDHVDTDFAQGHASLGAFTIKLDDPAHLSGTVLFSTVALQSLIAASNLSGKIKVDGTVSGAIPFTLSPEGFRIQDGHIAADRGGRLSIARSLWMQGTAAISSNAVQDFAYQALENMAFDRLTADLKSVAGGRLQIVFHIVGKNDPPTHQVAEVALTDVLNGTALYKPIPLPSGTPIDLTLDTSLNFDELLKSYAQAWSKSLSPGAGAGAKP